MREMEEREGTPDSIMHRQKCIRATRLRCTYSKHPPPSPGWRADVHTRDRAAPRRFCFRGKFMSFHMSGHAGRSLLPPPPTPAPGRTQYPPNGVRNYPFSTCTPEVLRLISGEHSRGRMRSPPSIAVPGEPTVGLDIFDRNSPFNTASAKRDFPLPPPPPPSLKMYRHFGRREIIRCNHWRAQVEIVASIIRCKLVVKSVELIV